MTTTRDLTILVFEGNNVRYAIDEQGVPWWVIVDVCKILEISDVKQAVARLDSDEKSIQTINTSGGDQRMNCTNISGFYRLIFRSDKPVASRITRWVTHEVLPAIHQHGYYGVLPESDRERVLALIAEARAELTKMRRAIVQPVHRPNRLSPGTLEDKVRYQIARFIERKNDGPSLTDLQNYLKRYSREEIDRTLNELVKRGELEAERTAHTVKYNPRQKKINQPEAV